MVVIFFEDVRGRSSLWTQFRTDLYSLQSHGKEGDCTGIDPAWLCDTTFEVTYRTEEIITESPVFFPERVSAGFLEQQALEVWNSPVVCVSIDGASEGLVIHDVIL